MHSKIKNLGIGIFSPLSFLDFSRLVGNSNLQLPQVGYESVTSTIVPNLAKYYQIFVPCLHKLRFSRVVTSLLP